MATIHQTQDAGDIVGTWYKSDKGTLGLIAQDGTPPYVCFFPPTIESGKLPHALFVRDGDLTVQVPQPDGSARYLSVNKILDHLAACECECDCPCDPPDPGLD